MDSNCSLLHDDYKVLVRCLTYNHSPYIVEALNGFSLQVTDFLYVCLVIDDFSTDGEQDTIKRWMNSECELSTAQIVEQDLYQLYIVRHKKNLNCFFAFYLLKQNTYADDRKLLIINAWRDTVEYEAFCEGDDYWTDPRKLKEQVDFLDNHKNYVATSSNALVYRSETTPMSFFGSTKVKDYYTLKEIVISRKFHTASVLYRVEALNNCPYNKMGQWDTFMWCCLLTQGPIHYDSKVTCVYRKQQQGVTETTRGIDWVAKMTEWADIITECFVPNYVKRRFVVRSITREIVEVAFIKNVWKKPENRSQLKSLYRYNFSIWNLTNDLKEVVKQCAKKVLRRKTPNSGYYQ